MGYRFCSQSRDISLSIRKYCQIKYERALLGFVLYIFLIFESENEDNKKTNPSKVLSRLTMVSFMGLA